MQDEQQSKINISQINYSIKLIRYHFSQHQTISFNWIKCELLSSSHRLFKYNINIAAMASKIEINSKGYFNSISEFKLLHDIGIGSFGKVKLALHRGTCKYYAIKIIDLTASLSHKQINLLGRQIMVHSKLDHPHVIKLWDTISDGTNIYMIMQYAQNGSLFNYHSKLLLEGKQPTPQQTYKFFYQTLQAIKYLHSIDIMHRDIKPENLLLDENLNIKLCDFGWATNQIKNSRTTFCGTYEYMAPEMVLQKSYDYKIDIWAIGVLIFQLVHGKAPFRADDLGAMKQRISIGSYEINSECSEQLKDLIVDILQFIPEKRLSISQIENQMWVKTCQKECIQFTISHQEQVSNNLKTRIKSQKALINAMPKSIQRGHHHQKSMGEFFRECNKNFVGQDYSIENYNQTHEETNKESEEGQMISQHHNFKKHRRNITQPILEGYQTNQAEIHKKSNSNRKLQMIFGNLQTQANTPIPLPTNQTYDFKMPSGKINKSDHKAKVHRVQEFDQYRPHQKKWVLDSEQALENKRKKTHMRTETGPIIGGNYVLSHQRNFSSSQLRENDLKDKEKAKKKLKVPQEKNSQKVKKIEQKLHEISGKYGTDKIKTQKIVMG